VGKKGAEKLNQMAVEKKDLPQDAEARPRKEKSPSTTFRRGGLKTMRKKKKSSDILEKRKSP